MRTAHGSGLDNSCESRNAKLVEEECIDVQLLSELKFQANDLAVPLDELALLAIETCARDYAQKFFSGDGKVVPSDDEMLEMMRWAQWSSTPKYLEGLRQDTPSHHLLRPKQRGDRSCVQETGNQQDLVHHKEV